MLVVTIASLAVAIAALMVSAGSVRAAKRSANAAEDSALGADRSAQASEGSLAIEAARRKEERKPRLTGKVERAGGRYQLEVTLKSDEWMQSVELEIPPGQGVRFIPGSAGVVTQDGRVRWAFSHLYGEAEQMEPREPMTWDVDVDPGLADPAVRIEAACWGTDGSFWAPVGIVASVEPDWGELVRYAGNSHMRSGGPPAAGS